MDKMIRICSRCQATLNKDNTGELGHLQPNCNDCTNKYSHECNHKFHGNTCILCGYVNP